MKSRITWAVSIVLFAVVSGLSSLGQDARHVDALMSRKLISSQDVLKGLVIEDFELMGRQAHQLRLYSQETDWNVLQTRAYQRLSGDFRRATSELEQAAADKNLDAASVAYIKLTLNCVDCHRHVRQQRTATSK